MPTDVATTDLDDAAFEPSPTGPAFIEQTDGSPIGVNSVLTRKRVPNQRRGRLALVAGLSMLALVAVAAGALAVLTPHKSTPAQAPLNVQTQVATPLPTTPAGGAAIAPPTTPAEPVATTTETSTAVTPAAPVAHRRALSPPATAPRPGRGPSDAAPAARSTPAPIVTMPAVPAQPATPATNQMAPVVGPTTAPPPPPAQPVTPQTATPQPQPTTPQSVTPQAVSDESPAPTLAKLPLSAILSQKT